MTENTMMTENTDTTTPTPAPAENTFGKAFNNVVLFPFRAVKFLLKWGFKVVLAILIIFTLLYAVNAALPMAVPEAQGMTTAQLYADRFKALVEFTKNKDGHPLFLVPLVVLFPVGYLMGPVEEMLIAYFPDGEFEEWARNKIVPKQLGYLYVPSLEPTLVNFPKNFKENVDRYTWDTWVSSFDYLPFPHPPTNK